MVSTSHSENEDEDTIESEEMIHQTLIHGSNT